MSGNVGFLANQSRFSSVLDGVDDLRVDRVLRSFFVPGSRHEDAGAKVIALEGYRAKRR